MMEPFGLRVLAGQQTIGTTTLLSFSTKIAYEILAKNVEEGCCIKLRQNLGQVTSFHFHHHNFRKALSPDDGKVKKAGRLLFMALGSVFG